MTIFVVMSDSNLVLNVDLPSQTQNVETRRKRVEEHHRVREVVSFYYRPHQCLLAPRLAFVARMTSRESPRTGLGDCHQWLETIGPNSKSINGCEFKCSRQGGGL